MAMENVWIFVLENYKDNLKQIQLGFLLNTVYFVFIHITIYTANQNPPKQ